MRASNYRGRGMRNRLVPLGVHVEELDDDGDEDVYDVVVPVRGRRSYLGAIEAPPVPSTRRPPRFVLEDDRSDEERRKGILIRLRVETSEDTTALGNRALSVVEKTAKGIKWPMIITAAAIGAAFVFAVWWMTSRNRRLRD